ncbi:MAG: TonB-dependent receptor plug domain-containing protein, partial [Prevotellaceae bacterium]|nr:TonB-dependent receptor plug domain-containing protein [Prevotellaceae bacterium]
MNKKSVTLGVALLMSGVAMAQTAVLGHVSDSEGNPIVNAAVRIGTRTVALTDGKGNFSLAKVPAGTKSLTIAYVGMKPRTMEISKNGTVNVVLEWDDSNLNEAIVVAYGTAKKASFTGSAATMSAQKLENRQVADVSRALNGTVAGVQTTSNNGQPGTSATIRVRGFGSINAEMNPLIVLDGVPYDGDLSSINPNDIENISVLKDAASAALYGARGANGVMLITTKKGKSGDAKIQFEGRWGVNSREISNYDVIRDPKAYMTHLYQGFYNENIYNNGLTPAQATADANKRIVKNLGYPVFTTPKG